VNRQTVRRDSRRGALEPGVPAVAGGAFLPFEPNWCHAGGDDPWVAIEAAFASVRRVRRRLSRDRGKGW
jgi:hypothetical protein